MAQPPRAATLTLKDLQGAVGAAVKAAADKHKLQVENDIAIGPGTLVGPRLRLAGLKLDNVQAMADEVAQAAQKVMGPQAGAAAAARPALESGFIVTRHIVICGFWPPPDLAFDFGTPFH
ncbi:MAG TPA: hypothetical protein VGC80_06480 [Acetobacteraceae bacterium]|jgi:hypothetical protein